MTLFFFFLNKTANDYAEWQSRKREKKGKRVARELLLLEITSQA